MITQSSESGLRAGRYWNGVNKRERERVRLYGTCVCKGNEWESLARRERRGVIARLAVTGSGKGDKDGSGQLSSLSNARA